MIGLLLREALDRLRVCLNMYLVIIIGSSCSSSCCCRGVVVVIVVVLILLVVLQPCFAIVVNCGFVLLNIIYVSHVAL